MGSQVLATIASVIMKLLVLFCVASFLVISSEARGREKSMKADEAVSEADAEGVYGVDLGESLSSLEKRSAQPGGGRRRNWVAKPGRKNADEAVSEADAEGVYGVGLGESLSSLEKRSAQPAKLGRKNADEAVSEADAEGVYGVGLGESLSSLEKRSAQPAKLGRKNADEAVS